MSSLYDCNADAPMQAPVLVYTPRMWLYSSTGD